jgi:hypothetical protein
MKAFWRHAFHVLLVASLTACGPTPKEKQMITDLTTHMKPVCMGRFVMNVPQDMVLGGDVTLYYGLDKNFKTVDVQIESLDATLESMRSQMNATAREIEADKNWESKKSMLLDYRLVNDHMIYLRKYRGMENATSSSHELHLLFGQTQLVLKADSFEGLDPDPDFPIEPVEQVQARLFKIASQIRTVDDHEKAGPGFCLGPVVIDSDNDEELASVYWMTSEYPDLFISIYSKALTPEGTDKPLLERASKIPPNYDFSALRKRDITIAGMTGQEWLGRTTDQYDNLMLYFRAESMRPNPALVRPAMAIELETGGQLTRGQDAGKYVASSLTPREAMALWDAIVSSIRVRPDAVRSKASSGVTKP